MHIVTGVFTPVLAKHSKSFSLIDCISVRVGRMQRNFEPSVSSLCCLSHVTGLVSRSETLIQCGHDLITSDKPTCRYQGGVIIAPSFGSKAYHTVIADGSKRNQGWALLGRSGHAVVVRKNFIRSPMCLNLRNFGVTALNAVLACYRPCMTADANLISRYNARRHAQAAAVTGLHSSRHHPFRRGRRALSLLAFLVLFPLRAGCRKLVSAQAAGLLSRA